MATYRIVKVRRSRIHGHVTAVAYRRDTGMTLKKEKVKSARKIRSMLEEHHFYTFNIETRQMGNVKRHTEQFRGLPVKTIRSVPGTVKSASLEELPTF